jgi:hypothetical protein
MATLRHRFAGTLRDVAYRRDRATPRYEYIFRSSYRSKFCAIRYTNAALSKGQRENWAALLVVVQGPELLAKLCFKVAYHPSRWSGAELSRKLEAPRQLLFDYFFFAVAIHNP